MPADPRPAGEPPADKWAGPTAAEFDQAFSVASPGIRRVWELAEPGLPPQIEPFSFVSAGLLSRVARALSLRPGEKLVDFGCGRGGPGLWLARETAAALTGVDFSPVAVDAGFTAIDLAAEPGWHQLYTRVYRVALELGDPGDDTPLADLQNEARRQLPLADLQHRVLVTATAPDSALARR